MLPLKDPLGHFGEQSSLDESKSAGEEEDRCGNREVSKAPAMAQSTEDQGEGDEGEDKEAVGGFVDERVGPEREACQDDEARGTAHQGGEEKIHVHEEEEEGE